MSKLTRLFIDAAAENVDALPKRLADLGVRYPQADPAAHRNDPDAPGPVRAGGWQLALYKRSLTIAFALLFLVSFLGHAWAGARRQTLEERRRVEHAEVEAQQHVNRDLRGGRGDVPRGGR